MPALGGAVVPRLVTHADWSVSPAKRWLVAAAREGSRWRVLPPRPVPPLATLFRELDREAAGGGVLLGLDLPFGLPRAYAAAAGVTAFVPALAAFGGDGWERFFDVAAMSGEIRLRRPFFPLRPGGARRADLVAALGLAGWEALQRRCDRATGARAAACCLFWTLGAQQVGKAAITAWRDLVGPALRAGADVAVWPFDGPIGRVGRPGQVAVAETYPAEIYGHLGVRFGAAIGGGKRRRGARAANADVLAGAASRLGATLDPVLRAMIEDGFGESATAEDRFDATVGCLGLLNVLEGARPSGEPMDDPGLAVEGWIMGQAA